jgi:hypothetical protein
MWGPKDANQARTAGPGAFFEYDIERNTSDIPLTTQEHVKSVLEVFRDANISPSFTADKLQTGSFVDRVEVFEDKVRGWWLAKAYALDPADDNSAHVILPVAAAVLIATERFRQGKPYKARRALFRDAFLKAFPIAPGSTGYGKRELYRLPDKIFDWVEAGVTPQSNLLINERGPLPLRVVGGTTSTGDSFEIVEINPKRFLDGVTSAFQNYVKGLKDPTSAGYDDLRQHFEQTTWALENKPAFLRRASHLVKAKLLRALE